MSDFDIVRFTKFMNDLENGQVKGFNKKQVFEQNYKNYKDMLEENFANELGNVVGDVMNSNSMKKLGFGLKNLTKAALEKFDDVVLGNSKSKNKFKKATKELFQTYKDDLTGLIENYFYHFELYDTNFWNDTFGLLEMSEPEVKSFTNANKKLITELRRESREYKKKMRELIKESKLSIGEYFTKNRKSNQRSDDVNNLLRAYKKWVKESSNKLFFPMIKDFSGYMILKYMQDKQQNESTKVAEIYTLIENLEDNKDESNI